MVPSQVDVLGVANPTANVTVRAVGGTTTAAARKGEYYHQALTVGNNVYPEVEVNSLYGSTQTQTGRVFNRPATEVFTAMVANLGGESTATCNIWVK